MTDIKELQEKFCKETGWNYAGTGGVLGVKGEHRDGWRIKVVPPSSIERMLEFIPLAEAFLTEFSSATWHGLQEALEKDVSLYHMRKILMVLGFKVEVEERK